MLKPRDWKFISGVLVVAIIGLLMRKTPCVSSAMIPDMPAIAPDPGKEWQWNGFIWTQVPTGAIAF